MILFHSVRKSPKVLSLSQRFLGVFTVIQRQEAAEKQSGAASVKPKCQLTIKVYILFEDDSAQSFQSAFQKTIQYIN